MSMFSVVFQDFRLLAYTLGQNIAASRDFSIERASECLSRAGFDERLKSMPQGLDTYLYKDYSNDGIEISGGEAQKIALARALYKNAPFIILDEPTAALDPVSEYEVYSSFNGIVGDKTVIYISHRLASCRFCHEIAVFDNGEIVQHGAHDELVADENGKYHVLWNAQAQYYH
jgi:ATP-binding cassette subfamily B protein